MLDHRRLLAALALAFAACARTDVGAPCNHGPGQIPQEPVITFPALACDQLLCVFAESIAPPEDPCETKLDCGTDERFACVEGRCELVGQYVLERSMCSANCGSDSDCEAADDTACSSGFACTPLMSLGEQCCEKVCVCRDELDVGSLAELEQQCEAGTAAGCCDRDPRPDACGP
ncbi:MAG TPA: hypothetical protein VG755_27630 [Nannocystaceae bacterium]|nr:hypothetical protein [Nannocystaceae bacterium]